MQGTEGPEAAGGLSKSQKKKQKKKAAAERKKVCEGADTGPTTPPGALPAQAEPHTAHALRTQLAGPHSALSADTSLHAGGEGALPDVVPESNGCAHEGATQNGHAAGVAAAVSVAEGTAKKKASKGKR